MTVGVEPLGTHVCTSAHEGVAWREATVQNRAHSKIGDFHFLLLVDQEIGGLYIPVHDLVRVQIIQPPQHLARHFTQIMLIDGAMGF